MRLVPCESCRRHVRAADLVCPFCKDKRTTSRLAAIAISSAIVLGGCDGFTAGAKYGGPPPPQPKPSETSSVEVAPPAAQPTATATATQTATATATQTATNTATAAPTVSSPRLQDTGGRLIAPAAKYGGPPPK
jgi:hypothetical protein